VDLAEPRFVKRGAFRVAGLAYRGKNQQGEIAALWEHGVMPRIGELAAIQVGVETYGVGSMPAAAAPGEFEYLAGVEVSSFEQLPEGMVGWEIPANRYAVLPAHGISELAPVADRFYGQWLPGSAYRAAGDYNLECYPPAFEQNQIIYWHFPVAPKGNDAR
jgi:AraC family transcriptional regulator